MPCAHRSNGRSRSGKIVYKENEYAHQEGNLFRETKRFYIFLEGGIAIEQQKRVNLFIQLLESIDRNDAKLLVQIKDRKWPFKKLTPAIINEAYPELIDGDYQDPPEDPRKDF